MVCITEIMSFFLVLVIDMLIVAWGCLTRNLKSGFVKESLVYWCAHRILKKANVVHSVLTLQPRDTSYSHDHKYVAIPWLGGWHEQII